MPFKATFDTRKISLGSTSNKQLKLPLVSSQFTPIKVEWGDGIIEDITIYNDPRLTHTYQKEGEYSVIITGSSFGLGFSNSGDRLKLLSIEDWGGLQLMIAGFQGCENLNLNRVIGTPENKIKNLISVFKGCRSLTQISSINTVSYTHLTLPTNREV